MLNAGRKISTIMMLKSERSSEQKESVSFTIDRQRESSESPKKPTIPTEIDLDVDDCSDSDETFKSKT
jgi:hypothetical protein